MTEAAQQFSEHDKAMMAEALALAARGCFTTSPNPNVGCVLTDSQGQVVGRGFHAKAGSPHAEVHALRDAALADGSSKAKGGTAYVTLEPCSHFGRTPPCADALIEAQLARVVVAMQDPYHEVAGRGLAKLREAGIDVAVGLFAKQAAALNKGFIKRATRGLPYVRVKLAETLDGRTALANGLSKWITGAEARHDVQFGRAQSSAILTGAGTVLADDPLLNVRLSESDYLAGATLSRALGDEALCAEVEPYLQAQHDDEAAPALDIRQPVRVVVDNRCEVHSMLQLFQVNSAVLLASPVECESLQQTDLPAHGQYLTIKNAPDSERVDLKVMLQSLADKGINDIWVEAGANLSGALLAQGLVDELIVYMAPKLMGPDAAGLLNLPMINAMDEVPSFAFNEVKRVGEDLKLVVRVT